MIAILCPTRGRPEQFNRMRQSIKDTTTSEVFLYAYSVENDYEWKGANVIVGPDYPTAHKWNVLAAAAIEYPETKLFILGADDMIFETPGWDKALIDHYNSLENKIHVYALQDSRDENGTPHVIVSREYIEALGYFVPPIFLHWFIDTWTVEIARDNNCFTHLREYSLRHDKPSDIGKPDETHSRIREWGWHSRDKYVNETMKHLLETETKRLKEKING